MSYRLFAVIAQGLAILGVPGSAHEVAGTQSAQLKTRELTDHRVVLDIVARPALADARDISVIDNGVPISTGDLMPVGSNDVAGGASQLILVVDAVNSSLQDVTRSEEAIKSFLKSSKSLPQITTIIILSDTPSLLTADAARAQGSSTTPLRERQLYAHRIPASTDPAVLIEALDSYKVGLHRVLESQAGPGQAERVQFSLQALSFLAQAEALHAGPKVVLWISPGWPFLLNSNAKSSEQLFDSIVYFSDLLRSARILLYAVSPEGVTPQDHSAETEAFLLSSRPGTIQANGHAPSVPVETSPTFYKQFLKGLRDAKGSNPNDLSLQVLAFQSGGLILQQNNDLKSQIAQCAADAQDITSFAYTPETNSAQLTYHAVEVNRPGGTGSVRTRTGYYAR